MATIVLPPKGWSLREILAEAAVKESRYEWLQAADLYQQTLGLKPGIEPLERAKVTELLARSYFKAAFQAETREEFLVKMQLAKETYQDLAIAYGTLGQDALSKRSQARALFAGYWRESESKSRSDTISKCLELGEEVVASLKTQSSTRMLAEAHKDLLVFLLEAYRLSSDWDTLKGRFERALDIGQEAIAEFEKLGDNEGLLESLYVTLWFLKHVAFLVLEPGEFQGLTTKQENLAKKINALSQQMGTFYASALAEESSGRSLQDKAEELKRCEAAALAAQNTGDKYAIGRPLVLAGEATYWVGLNLDDLDRRREFLERGLELNSRAIDILAIPLQGHLLEWAYDNLAECETYLAIFVEAASEEKISRLRRAVEVAKQGLVYAGHSGWPGTPHGLSKAMYFLATMYVSPAEKRELLLSALPMREETVRLHERVLPHSWNLGVMRNYLALLRAELSKMEQDSEKRIELLRSAVNDMEGCVAVCAKWATDADSMRALAYYYEWFGDIVSQLYLSTGRAADFKKTIRAYEETIDYLTKSKHVPAIAQVRWKIAKVLDLSGDFRNASDSFRKAAEDFREAAKTMQGLPSLSELSFYMEAWAEIDDARSYHRDAQYQSAAEHYNRAAEILHSTKGWSYLSKHYTACSLLEQAEALSHEENHGESIELFSSASQTFGETGRLLEAKQSHEAQKAQEIEKWLRIMKSRQHYSNGRMVLEEAKLLDKRGGERASSGKYRTASSIFNDLLSESEDEQDRKEVKTLALFCDAWAWMKEAEGNASTQLYSEASASFLKAAETTPEGKYRLQALASASICKALEQGLRLQETQNPQLYTDIKKHLETSASYYEKAGLDNAADWTRATQRLFDALVYLSDAETERNAKNKTELFHLAEKHLELSARLYGNAGFERKKEEVLRHLRRAREEKQLLLTPVQVLVDNPSISGAPVAPASLLRDQAFGLERFETANLVGNLTVTPAEAAVGSDLTLELEIANMGKTAATLVKVEDITPKGLEMDRARVSHRVEDNYIDMKGKRLEHLKTHEVRIGFRATHKGTFELTPRILFVDERGNYQSYRFEPATVTIRELGISGWLKGPK